MLNRRSLKHSVAAAATTSIATAIIIIISTSARSLNLSTTMFANVSVYVCVRLARLWILHAQNRVKIALLCDDLMPFCGNPQNSSDNPESFSSGLSSVPSYLIPFSFTSPHLSTKEKRKMFRILAAH